MSWEKVIKTSLIERGRANVATRKPGYAQGQADCKVKSCVAKMCIHNKDNRCTLSHITIDSQGVCEQHITSENAPVMK